MQKPSETEIIQLDYEFDAQDGGISKNGKFYWMSSDNELELYRLPQGTRSCKWTFTSTNEQSIITCVEEVTIGQRLFLSVGVRTGFHSSEIKLIDPSRCVTVRTIHFRDFVVTSFVRVPNHNMKPLHSQSMDSQLFFQSPLAVGTLQGETILLDLHFNPKDSCSMVDGEELLTDSYESPDELRKRYNHPFVILDQNSQDNEHSPPMGVPITALHVVTSPDRSRHLLIGSEDSRIALWSLETLSRTSSYVSPSSLPVFSFSGPSESLETSFFVACFSKLSATRSRVFSSVHKGSAEVITFSIQFSSEGASFDSSGSPRNFRMAQDRRSPCSVVSTSVLPEMNGGYYQALLVWKSSRNANQLCMEIISLDGLSSTFLSFEATVPTACHAASILPRSIEIGNSSREPKYLRDWYKFPAGNGSQLSLDSVSFQMLLGGVGCVSRFSYVGSQKQVLQHIARNIEDLSSTAQLKNELEKCKSVGLIERITENEALFDFFDLLLRQRMLCILCRHIASADRLEPVAEWLLQKCRTLHKLMEPIHNQFDSDGTSASDYVSEVEVALSNLGVLLNAIASQVHRLRPEDTKYQSLLEVFSLMQTESQYLELWDWFYQNRILFKQFSDLQEGSFMVNNDQNIQKMLEEAKLEKESYPPRSPLSLINDCWKNYSDPSDIPLLVSKMKVIFYFLLEILITPQSSILDDNIKSYNSFLQTFMQILTPSSQNMVRGYFLLDNLDQAYSFKDNASHYFGFDKTLPLVVVAYEYLSAPGVVSNWPSVVFHQMKNNQGLYFAKRYIQSSDVYPSKQEQQEILRILLPQNLMESLHFIRTHTKPTLEYDEGSLRDMMNILFEYCHSAKKMESLFLLALTKDEEQLLLSFLGDYSPDLKVLFYLQRSEFSKAVESPSSSYDGHVNNYKTVLPPALLKYSKKDSKMQLSAPSQKAGLPDLSNTDQRAGLNTPKRYTLSRTPKTEKPNSRISSHSTFMAPSMMTGTTKRARPFTPHVIPNTPASRIRMVHGTPKFAPFQKSASRTRTPRKINQAPIPSVIPFV